MMKKFFTRFLAALALLVFMMPSMAGWGQTRTDVVAYFLDPVSDGDNGYATASDIDVTYGDITITWNVTGNSTMTPWRIGGKNLNGVDREIYSKDALSDNVTKIEVKHGAASSVTVNSWTVIVASDAAFSNIVSTLTPTFAVNTTTTINRPDGVNWTGCYYKFVYNVTIGGNNKFIEFTEAKFYKESSDPQATATTTTIDPLGITNTDVNTSTEAGSLSATVSANDEPIEGATVSWSGNNDAVATIDNDGVVTLVGAGTVTFTAAYAGVSGTYQASYDEYEMTVTNSAPTVVDVLNCTWTGVTGSSAYTSWSNKAGSESDAVYAGNTARYTSNNNNAIQMRNTNSSGIVTTTSGGKVKKIEVTWNTGTSSSRTLSVYGKNTAYSGPGDLQNSTTRGTLIGSVTYNTSGTTTTVVNVNTDYEYVGLLASGALYLDEIDITWLPNAVKTPTFTPAPGSYVGTQSVTISCETENATIYYTIDGTTPSASNGTQGTSVSISETTTIKAIAYVGEETSGVASGTFTIVQPLTTIQEVFDASNTSGSYYIAFNNWVVTGINTGGTSTRAYITDGEKGVCIYNYSGHGFSAGDKISGTIECSLSRSSGGGYAQINNITRTTVGLTVTNDGVATPANIALADLSGEHTGVLVSYNDLVYSSTGPTLSDGNASIKPQGELMSLSNIFTEGKKYHVTGVYINYTNYSGTLTRELCPRSAADIILAPDLDIDASMTPFSYIVGEGPSAWQNIDVICTDLGNNPLTVTASSDYEISLVQDGNYTQSVEMTPEDGGVLARVYVRLRADLLVGEHNGTVTFTATNLTTATVNVTGLVTETQTYDVVLDDVVNGTISADPMLVAAGDIVTLTAIPDDCYQFTTWVTEPTVTWVSDNQFTMPEDDVLVSATFTQKTFVVTYSFNGDEIWTTSTITCGETTNLLDEDDLTALEVVIPSGFYFQGWSEEEGSSTLVSSPYTPTATRTLYAVLTYGESEAYYARVTSDLGTNWAGDYLIAYSNTIFADGRVGGKDDTGAIGKAGVQVDLSLNITGNNISATNGDIYKVTLEEISEGSNTYVLRTQDGRYNYQTTNANGLTSSTNKETAAAYPITVTFTSENDIKLCLGGTAIGAVFRYNTGSGGLFRYYKDGGQSAVYLYKRTVSEAPNFNNVTVYNDPLVPEPVLDDPIPETTCVIVGEGTTLTMNGANNGTAANLIIEEGGQLIYTGTGSVAATIKRSIAAPAKESNDKWYTISSPVNNVASASVKNLISSTDVGFTYDLYLYNEPTHYWFNQKNDSHAALFENLTNGRGYLYWNSTGSDLEFAGTLNTSDVVYHLTYTDAAGELKGFNLIGNPFSHNIYKGAGAAIDSDKLADGYYTLSNENAWHANIFSAAIAPTQGILVQATEEFDLTIANSTTVATAEKKNASFIEVVASNKDYNDVAYAVFGKGIGLNKIDHLNTEIPEVYFWKNNERFAVASLNEDVEEIALNFKAATEGSYDIKVKFDGDFNYLHLIDNMTGADVDLLATPSYSFEVKTTDYASRFRLVFSANNGTNEDANETFAYFNGSEWVINNPSTGSGSATLQVIDVMGRVLRSEQINGNAAINLNQAAGIYMLRLINGENVMVQKVVVR